MPLIVLIIVFFTGSFFAGAGFLFTIVVPVLVSLDSLVLLALPFPALGGAAAGAALFPRPTPVLELVLELAVTLRAAAVARVVLALSTMLDKIPAAPPVGTGAAGFNGEIGRANIDFNGGGRIGERGNVREFADLGESTWAGSIFEVVRAGGTGGPRGRFFGFSISSFSLSVEDIWSLNLFALR